MDNEDSEMAKTPIFEVPMLRPLAPTIVNQLTVYNGGAPICAVTLYINDIGHIAGCTLDLDETKALASALAVVIDELEQRVR